MANRHMERLVSCWPNTTPMAMPVKAECPRASEKKSHFPIDNHCPHQAKQGRDNQYGQKRILHKIILQPRENSHRSLSFPILLLWRLNIAPDCATAIDDNAAEGYLGK